MTLKDLYEASPFGMISSLFYGTIQSALFTLLAVYATSMNFTILEISIVTFLLAVSGAIAQFPIGKLSDIYDRRKVIVFSTFGAAVFSILAILVSRQMYLPGDLATSKFWFYVFLVLFSFASLPMFAIIFAHTNDFIPKEKFILIFFKFWTFDGKYRFQSIWMNARIINHCSHCHGSRCKVLYLL